MKTAFIIRFHYEENDPRFAWRFAYFRDSVLPRILANGDDFDIAIRCNPAHDQIFKDLSPRIRVFHVRDEYADYKRGRFFFDFVPWDRVIDLPRYELQIGLDSDDLIDPDQYVMLLRMHTQIAIERDGDRPYHLFFQPELLDVKTGEIHTMPQRYTPGGRGSAFFAIYQPAGSEPYRFAYEESHLTIGKRFADSFLIESADGPMCFASCHHLNESTHI